MRSRSGLVLAFILALFLVTVSSFGCGGSDTSTSRTSKAAPPTAVGSSMAGTTTTSLAAGSSAAADAVARRVAASLVTVEPSGTNMVGGNPGLVYSADGLILTSWFDTFGPNGQPLSSFKVKLSDGETVTAKLVGTDRSAWLALLRVKKSGLTPARLASGKPRAGEWVALISNIGSPLTSIPASVVILHDSPGLVRAKPAESLQSDIEPVAFDRQGDVVGLFISTVATPSQGGGTETIDYFTFVPADKVAAAVARLLSGS